MLERTVALVRFNDQDEETLNVRVPYAYHPGVPARPGHPGQEPWVIISPPTDIAITTEEMRDLEMLALDIEADHAAAAQERRYQLAGWHPGQVVTVPAPEALTA